MLEKDFSRVPHRTFELRQKADYLEQTEVTKQDIDEIQPQALAFVNRLEAYLQKA